MAEFEPVTLFVRGDEDASGDDAWDDTILVEQYNRSVNQLKNKVAKLMGVNNSEGDSASGKDDANSHTQSRRKKHRKKKPTHSWTAGAFCRAKYSADKQFYEAVIMTIDHGKGMCTVRYLGYDNQEEVYLDGLQPSKGHSARKAQYEQALAEQFSGVKEEEDTEEVVHSESFSEKEESNNITIKDEQSFVGRRPSKGQKGKTSPYDLRMLPPPDVHMQEGRVFGGPSHCPPLSSLPPPPPPPPPHFFEHLPNDDGEALSAMLMSWYMSGYHTGYYYGLKQGKSQQNKHHRGKWRKN